MNGINFSDATDIKLGSSSIAALYYGFTLLWPLGPHDYSQEYLTIEATSNSAYFDFKIDNELDYSRVLTIQWSKDKINWNSKTSSWDNNKIYLSKGEKVFLKGTNSYYGRQQPEGSMLYSGSNYLYLKDVKVYGNIMSMIYGDNFYGQTALSTSFTFRKFFWNSSNIDASNLILPSTELTYGCYAQMFYDGNCISAPELPATTLAPYCYYEMFADTNHLTITPELPALTLADHCYYGMFKNCTYLEQALELPATTLATSCYANMFNGCYELNYIKCLATDISATSCLSGWVNGVAATGTFVKNPNMTSWPTGVNGIPSGWTVQNDPDHDYSQDYLTFEALEQGTFTWTDTQNINSIYYSTDNGSTWSTLAPGLSTPTIATNSKVLFKASNLTVTSEYGIGTFISTGAFNAMGNIMSLVYGDNFVNQTTINSSYQLCKLFYNCTTLVDASNLILPATTLATNCYNQMFGGCTALTVAPELPATTLVANCYKQMFRDCTSLTTSPELPATTLANNCYRNMFTRCSSLVTVSELPATTLDVESYRGMFINCTSLNYIKCLATDISANGCLYNWVNGVAATGTFVKNPNMSSWPTGVNGIPTGWTIQNAS